MTIMMREESSLARPAEVEINWHFINELLQTAQYEQIAAQLAEMPLTSEEINQIPLAGMLAAARFLCLACSHYQAEEARHRQAYAEVYQREHELRQCLQAMLDWACPIETDKVEERPDVLFDLPSDGLSFPELILATYLDLPPLPPDCLDEKERSLTSPSTEQAISTKVVDMPAVKQVGTPVAAQPEAEPQATPFSLVIHCLGAFRVYQQGQVVNNWNGRKGQAILKYLLAHQETPVAKEVLMDIFWPEANPKAAQQNLNQAIYNLRKALGQDQVNFPLIQFEHDCYSLNPEVKIWLDYSEFKRHAQLARRLERSGQLTPAMTEYRLAVDLYRGDFLEEDLFEEWTGPLRDQIRYIYLELADRLSDHYLQEGDETEAIALCQQMLVREKCHEPAYQRLMMCYERQGQRHLAIRQYLRCVETLRTELDVSPSPETQALYERIISDGK